MSVKFYLQRYNQNKCATQYKTCHIYFMTPSREVFINNLKFFRKKFGLRQLDLSLEIGKSSNYINSVENGKYFPSPETIDKISTVFEIHPSELFLENGCPENVRKFSKAEFIETVSTNLFSNLKPFITSEMQAILSDSSI